MRLIVLLAIGLSIPLTGCATATRGVNNDVEFTSNPSGAQVETTNGHSCTTPCTISMSRKDEFTANFTHDGETKQVPVRTVVSGGGGAALAGNVLAGGIVGVGVDAVTGAALNHVPNPVHADFSEDEPTS